MPWKFCNWNNASFPPPPPSPSSLKLDMVNTGAKSYGLHFEDPAISPLADQPPPRVQDSQLVVEAFGIN